MPTLDMTALYNLVVARLRDSGALARSIAAMRRIDPTQDPGVGYDIDTLDYTVECLRRDGSLPDDVTMAELADAIVAEFEANLASFERHCRVHIVRY